MCLFFNHNTKQLILILKKSKQTHFKFKALKVY